MSELKTLLSLSGADTSSSSYGKSVIVLVDCQQEYIDGALPLPGVEAALEEVSKLLDRARTAGAPIIHIAHKGQVGGVFDRSEGGKGAIAETASPEAGEFVVEKGLPNAFAGTDLADKIRETGRSEIILAGFMTHMCISSTARAALDLGFRTTIVSKAAGTRDLPRPDGGVVSAAELHAVSLAGLADRFSIIVETAQDIPD